LFTANKPSYQEPHSVLNVSY